FGPAEIAVCQQNLFPLTVRMRDDFAEGSGDKRVAPEFDSAFASDPIDRRDVDAVCDRMRALNQLPCVALLTGNQFWLIGNPADRSGVNENLRPRQCRRARAFGKPLVPTHKRADFCVTRLKAWKSEIARGEVEFFIVERIVRDVHLAVDAGDRVIGVEDHGSVMVDPRGPSFEHRSDDDDLSRLCKRAQSLGRWSRNRFSEPEVPLVFALAKIT